VQHGGCGSLQSKRFCSTELSTGLKHFSLFECGREQKNARRGRGGEKRKRLPANTMIMKNAPLSLLQLDNIHSVTACE